MGDKIFIIVDDCVWNYDGYVNIVGITRDKDIAKQLLNKYVKKTKEEIKFEELNAIKDSNELNYDNFDGCWIYSQSETDFLLYQNGKYNSNHIDISIIEKKIISNV
ncbi:MAG: hypothetical protein Q4G04_01375 [bacterium]|nr:hypothetical protein [bacterium]